VQGIIGNDGRHYVLDLLRTFPPDVNFLPGELNSEKHVEFFFFFFVEMLNETGSIT
jgi:hypothetical protein